MRFIFSAIILFCSIEFKSQIKEISSEFKTTIDWIKGKANLRINYFGDNGNNYENVCHLDNTMNAINYNFYTLTNGKKNDLGQVVCYKFNLKDISYFEIYDDETSNSYYKVVLFTYNSENKIKWDIYPDFKTYILGNHVEIFFNNYVNKDKVRIAFTDLLKYAGSKKEKY